MHSTTKERVMENDRSYIHATAKKMTSFRENSRVMLGSENERQRITEKYDWRYRVTEGNNRSYLTVIYIYLFLS